MTQEEQNQPQFAIQRIYVKDLSLESPSSPQVFLEQWEPEMSMDLSTQSNKLDAQTYEVVLALTVTVKMKEKVVFLVEVKQAGIFSMTNFAEDQMGPMLGSYCPNVLYPYARETVTDAVIRAGFPQLYLMPVNFDAIYEQQRQQQSKQDGENVAEESGGSIQ
jgi:preprotein translocase subunit SecB